jgi:hypothetical protein
LITDPDYLNQNLIAYLTKKEAISQATSSKEKHAATYEDFIKLIKSSISVDEIKQHHLKVINEIIQVTFISNKMTSTSAANKSSVPNNNSIINSGLSSFYAYASLAEVPEQNEFDAIQYKSQQSSEKNTKAEMLRSRDLKTYLKQLR